VPLGGNWVEVDQLNPFRLAAGRPPRTDEEVVIDRGSAKQTGYRVGDTVTVLSPDLAGRLERLPEVKAASGIRQGLAVVGGAART
jgi:hypothetical protein